MERWGGERRHVRGEGEEGGGAGLAGGRVGGGFEGGEEPEFGFGAHWGG